jgi:hypothetical protein
MRALCSSLSLSSRAQVEQYIFKSGSLEMKHLRRLLDLLPCLKLLSCAMSASPATALKLVNKEPPYGASLLCRPGACAR